MISVITPTHNPKYLGELYKSLKDQSYTDWEWIIMFNGSVREREIKSILPSDKRIKILSYTGKSNNIGEIKKVAFSEGTGDILVELDHDDLLLPAALEEVYNAFQDEKIGFVYSDCADWSPTDQPITYYHQELRKGWEACGWKFRETTINDKKYLAPYSWEPSAASISLIFYAPNHLRAWRKSIYQELGGHNPEYAVADDHELVVRTYLHTHMIRIPKVLYLYRVETNTWSQRTEEIKNKTFQIMNARLHELVAREMKLSGYPCYDLGGGFDCPPGWISVDVEGGTITADLKERWPFEDNSVGAFRAFDFLEHLPDKMHSIGEIYRCLKPGGYLLSMTPSALGQGAFQDPTHCSYWVENSFRYYTEARLAKYIKNTSQRFMEVRLFQTSGDIPYVVADLIKLDGNIDGAIPGIKKI